MAELKQINKIELELEGPIRKEELIRKIIFNGIGDIFYSAKINKIETRLEEDK